MCFLTPNLQKSELKLTTNLLSKLLSTSNYESNKAQDGWQELAVLSPQK